MGRKSHSTPPLESGTIDTKRLRAWFRQHQRQLPWRETRDPYAVWVSEIMLQQTQVASVIGYFNRFLAELPTIADLAAAEEERVLRLWEGLGYYSRARRLHQAAQRIMAEHGGRFPTDIDQVRALPGIGRYTAGAILSIACDQRHPILEANTVRLYARLLGYRGDPRSVAGAKALWSAAENWLPQRGAGEFNQALMELGSLVCTPTQPACHECPLAAGCIARALGLVAEIPPPARRPETIQQHETALVIRRRSRVLLLRRAPGERWAGLWDFPRFMAQPADDLAALVRERLGLEIVVGQQIAQLKHQVTHHRITLDCYAAEWVSGPEACPVKGALKWADPAQLEELPLSVTGRKLARLAVGVGGE